VKSHLRGLVLLVFLPALVVLGGAGRSAASTATHCNPPAPAGRLFCVTIEDLDGVSPSGTVGSGPRQAEVEAYQFYKLTIQNVGGSTLTNGTLSVVLSDNLPGDATADSSALYVPSPAAPSCAVVSTSPNRVDCGLEKLAAGESTPTIVLGYRTSTAPGVVSTDAAVTVAFKEGSNPNGANPSSLTFAENTNLEPDPEGSVAWSMSGQHVELSTSPTVDSQFTSLQYDVPAAQSSFTATMDESDGQACAPGLACFGELVTTDLSAADPGTFTATNPFHLQVTMDLLPETDPKTIVMSHQLDTGTFEVISRRCGRARPPDAKRLPCITVKARKRAKLLIIDVFGYQNGGWHPGVS
jgi:hypothetical protein